jgi:hypothetical protein
MRAGVTDEWGSSLLPQHREVLIARAVSAQVARERGYRSATEKAALGRFGFTGAQQQTPALVIPIHAPGAGVVAHVARPDAPRLRKDKPLKYEWPWRAPLRLDVPPAVAAAVTDAAVPLWVTEGPIKADALVSAGAGCAVAVNGTFGWRNGDGPLADWEHVRLRDRLVRVCFDSDAMTKHQVHDALTRLALWLGNRGATVAFVYLPTDAGKVGVDDFLAAGASLADVEALTLDELRPLGGTTPGDGDQLGLLDDVPDEPGHEVLDDVERFIGRFVAFPAVEALEAVTLWVAHTWAIDALDSTPRLSVRSPEKQSGKTRLLELLELLARRARLSVSMTVAYMFRSIEASCPTLLIDEVDTIFGKRAEKNHEELRALINAGHRRGATVGRMVGEGAAMAAKDFACFCPVAMAGLGRLPDTIHDRCVVIELRRRARDEDVEPYRLRHVRGEANELARRLAAWAARHHDELAAADPEMPEGITDRPADCWAPLLAVADVAGGGWPTLARDTCLKLDEARAADDGSIGVRLLGDVRTIFTDAGTDRLASATIVEALARIEEAPWGDWYGKPVTTRWLAAHLRPFAVRPRNMRTDTDAVVKGYFAEDLHDAWTRYVPSDPPI